MVNMYPYKPRYDSAAAPGPRGGQGMPSYPVNNLQYVKQALVILTRVVNACTIQIYESLRHICQLPTQNQNQLRTPNRRYN